MPRDDCPYKKLRPSFSWSNTVALHTRSAWIANRSELITDLGEPVVRITAGIYEMHKRLWQRPNPLFPLRSVGPYFLFTFFAFAAAFSAFSAG